jgi:hypothetical protein
MLKDYLLPDARAKRTEDHNHVLRGIPACAPAIPFFTHKAQFTRTHEKPVGCTKAKPIYSNQTENL